MLDTSCISDETYDFSVLSVISSFLDDRRLYRNLRIDASRVIALRRRDKRRRAGTEDGPGAWRRPVFPVAARRRLQRLRRILTSADQAVSTDDARVSVPSDRMAAASSGSRAGAEPGPAEYAGAASGRCRSSPIPQSSSPASSASDVEQSYFGTGDYWTSSQRTSFASRC